MDQQAGGREWIPGADMMTTAYLNGHGHAHSVEASCGAEPGTADYAVHPFPGSGVAPGVYTPGAPGWAGMHAVRAVDGSWVIAPARRGSSPEHFTVPLENGGRAPAELMWYSQNDASAVPGPGDDLYPLDASVCWGAALAPPATTTTTPPAVSPPTTVEAVPAPPVTTSITALVAPSPILPETGSEAASMALVGLAFLVMGAALMAAAVRRKRAEARP